MEAHGSFGFFGELRQWVDVSSKSSSCGHTGINGVSVSCVDLCGVLADRVDVSHCNAGHHVTAEFRINVFPRSSFQVFCYLKRRKS